MKRPKANKTSKKVLDRVDDFRLKHKGLFVLIVIGLTVLVFGSLLKFGSYQSKFSDKDYAALETAAERVFKNVGAGDTEKYEYCTYEAPEKYSSTRLYCEIDVVAYLPYTSDERAIEVAKALEARVKGLGPVISHLSEFYEQPSGNRTGLSVNLAPPYKRNQCHFTIATNDQAKDVSNFFPKKTDNNLIALHFYCSAESREEYFPVTYRQGD